MPIMNMTLKERHLRKMEVLRDVLPKQRKAVGRARDDVRAAKPEKLGKAQARLDYQIGQLSEMEIRMATYITDAPGFGIDMAELEGTK